MPDASAFRVVASSIGEARTVATGEAADECGTTPSAAQLKFHVP